MESADEGRRPFACIMVQEEHFDYGLFAITKELEELLVPKIPNTPWMYARMPGRI